jgi:hypothetical protein
MLITILLVLAFVLLLVQALGVTTTRFHLGWAGLACAVLAAILTRWPV